ncbi:MAG: hypothetical protein H6814_05815 [Phycisphaeraceae bacterium]|nr:hypothetical protein [Phycisphaeraceae bacterium]
MLLAAILLLPASCKKQPGGAGANPSQQAAQPAAPPAPPHEPSWEEQVQAMVGLSWQAPPGWNSVHEFKASRLDTWVIDGADDSVSCFAFSFGPDTNKVVERNLRRWSPVVRLADDSNAEPDVESFDLNGLHVTIGTYTGQRIVGLVLDDIAPQTNDTVRLLGAIVQGGPAGSIFFQLSGRRGAVEALTPGFLELVRSVKVIDTPADGDGPTP